MKERETSIAAMTMTTERILEQLSSLKDNSESFAKAEDADPIWQKDIEALEAAISMISTLEDEGVHYAEALKDLIFDYNLSAKQNKELHRKFEVAAKIVRRDGVFHCPECNHLVGFKHSHCHWCGKKLGGW